MSKLVIAFSVISLSVLGLVAPKLPLEKQGDRMMLFHVIFMVLAFGIVFPRGMIKTLGVNGDEWRQSHMWFQIIGYALLVGGFWGVWMHKVEDKVPHFESSHALLGITLITLLSAQALMGLLKVFYRRAGVLALRFHGSLGMVLYSLGMLNCALGLLRFVEFESLDVTMAAAAGSLLHIPIIVVLWSRNVQNRPYRPDVNSEVFDDNVFKKS